MFNELVFKALYEDKKREMKEAILAYKYSKELQTQSVYETNALPSCCDLSFQEICCENLK